MQCHQIKQCTLYCRQITFGKIPSHKNWLSNTVTDINYFKAIIFMHFTDFRSFFVLCSLLIFPEITSHCSIVMIFMCSFVQIYCLRLLIFSHKFVYYAFNVHIFKTNSWSNLIKLNFFIAFPCFLQCFL